MRSFIRLNTLTIAYIWWSERYARKLYRWITRFWTVSVLLQRNLTPNIVRQDENLEYRPQKYPQHNQTGPVARLAQDGASPDQRPRETEGLNSANGASTKPRRGWKMLKALINVATNDSPPVFDTELQHALDYMAKVRVCTYESEAPKTWLKWTQHRELRHPGIYSQFERLLAGNLAPDRESLQKLYIHVSELFRDNSSEDLLEEFAYFFPYSSLSASSEDLPADTIIVC